MALAPAATAASSASARSVRSLSTGMALDHGAARFELRQQRRGDRIEVADQEIDTAAAPPGVHRARVGGHDEGVARQVGDGVGRARIAAGEDQRQRPEAASGGGRGRRHEPGSGPGWGPGWSGSG